MLLGGLLSQGMSAGQTGGRAPKGKKAEPAKPEKERGPYTLFEILDGLKKVEPLEPGRMAALVEKRGVTFNRGPEVTAILKEAGASDALLALVPEPPPPPPPKVAGDLTVGCAPRDCEVVVGSQYEGRTESGRKKIAGLAPGEVEITVFSDGYDPASKRVPLEENRPAEQVFVLQPSQNTRDQLGAAFALETINALGGLIGATELPAVSGTIELVTPNGPAPYKIRYTRGGAAGGTLEVTGQNLNCTAVMTRESVRPQCKGKAKPGVMETTEKVARMLWDHDLAVMLDRALAGKITAEAWLDARRLASETAAARMVLLINSDHLPVEIEIQPKKGPAEKVMYSDFAIAGKSKYPRKTVVVQGGKTVATIQFQ